MKLVDQLAGENLKVQPMEQGIDWQKIVPFVALKDTCAATDGAIDCVANIVPFVAFNDNCVLGANDKALEGAAVGGPPALHDVAVKLTQRPLQTPSDWQ